MTKIAVSVAEATELTGIGRTKLYALINTGEIEARKCNARTLILWSELERFLRSLPRMETRQ